MQHDETRRGDLGKKNSQHIKGQNLALGGSSAESGRYKAGVAAEGHDEMIAAEMC
jgi:hypothetical protein